ncbi:MAG: 30S ribosomal protein S18 [Candidatus Sungbacteria bacterium]|uniref:Small ribosomal subunit protein bS18 n=1 Tax=Candidatus Sungiibacteriota bacterium TaxID=2750080 RepID=A0A933DTS5_9BACT|nr:30S ribosomal protein S18 [Candidatus Sungbacteria bacterium]
MAEQKQCFFCTSSHKVVDYKDTETLRRFMSANMKIMPRRRSHLCASHQRNFARAIKRARELGLVPYTLH